MKIILHTRTGEVIQKEIAQRPAFPPVIIMDAMNENRAFIRVSIRDSDTVGEYHECAAVTILA